MTHTARREDAIGEPPQRPTLVRAERYYSSTFAQLEVDRMWPKVWQLACTVDHECTRAFAAQRGVDLSWASTDQMMWLHQYNVFPNMTLLTNADHLTVMTAHPGPDPDTGELVTFLWMRMPPGAPRNKPADVRMKADEAHPGLVLTQDITVLPGLQRGLHQPGLTHLTLSNEERRVINMHRNLERYLQLPKSDCLTGGDA